MLIAENTTYRSKKIILEADMNYSNQYGFSNDQKLSFTPVLSKVSSMGTTVTYGIQTMSNVNASNTGLAASGNYAGGYTGAYVGGNYAGGFASGNYSAVPTSAYYNQYSINQWPTINAGYSNPYSNLSSGYFGFAQTPYNQTLVAQPSVDISETTSDVCVAAYLPNVTLNDVSLSVTDNSVTISASAWTGNQNVLFNRTIALPTSIHAESVDASMQSGVLEIRLPKAEKVSRKRNTLSQDNINTTNVTST